jgi:hypothetical protein
VSSELDVEKRISVALKYLEEGRSLIDEDPVQASEKLYKAAEEAVKALAHHFNWATSSRGLAIEVSGPSRSLRRLS